jgi:Flp pilus assembly protein TadD
MKPTAPLTKSILVPVFVILLFSIVSVDAQRRGSSKSQRQTVSKAAGLVDEADKLADDKKYPEAIETYKIAIRLDPNYAPAFGGLGDAYLNSGNSQQAEVAYKEQVRLAPNDADAQYDLGYFYNAMGRHGEAFGPLVKATSLDPTFAEAFYGIGYAYSRGTEFEKAIGFYRGALKNKPDYADAYYGLGEAYARMGKADLASEQLKKLNTIDPKLARKLEKEMASALAAADAERRAASSESVSQMPTPPKTQQAVPVATQSQPPAAQTTPANTPKIEQTSQPKSAVTSAAPEATSRQLQQVPQPPSQQSPSPTNASPSAAAAAEVTTNQVTTLPVSNKRWALVIGVNKYTDPQISPLKGSDNDAQQIADALVRYAGFPRDQVILLSTSEPLERQPTRVNVLRRLSNLSTTIPKDGLLLVSFAGHGMERSGQAFLLPSDAQISDSISFLEETAISMARVKSWIKETGVGQVVVLLDACRNDPGGRADAPNPLSNTYVNAFNFDVRNREVQAFATIYATGIGQRAYEYTEKKQGYFSWAVVEGLRGAAANDKGEVTLAELVKFIQDTVPKRITVDLGSTKQQKPFAIVEGYRADELVIAVTGTAANTTGNSSPNVTMIDPAAIELSFWESIKTSSNPDDFKAYLEKYPDGQFAALAKLRVQGKSANNSISGDSLDMTYWNAIKDSKNPAGFMNYMAKFPNGLFVELAKSRIAELETERAEREKARAAAEELMVDGSFWVGKTEAGLDAKFEFQKGGAFSGTYEVRADKPQTLTVAGVWRQNGEAVTVQLSKPSGFIQLNISDITMTGTSDQTKFSMQRVLMKLRSTAQDASPCNLNGFKIRILYRKKDKVDKSQDAEKLAAKFRSLGLQVEVEKVNSKDAGTSLVYFNGQGGIAHKIAECLKDNLSVTATDGGSFNEANLFLLWLQH